MKREWGRVHVPDERDKKFGIQVQRTARTSRYWNTRVCLDQGSTSSCVGHAWSHWLVGPPIKQFVKPIGLYEICKFFDEWKGENYDGTSVRAGAKILKMLGFISEYRWGTRISQLEYALLEEGPVVVGTSWYEGMSKGGDLSASGSYLGGHAYLLDGVNAEVGEFRIKNSWGAGWGKNGRAWIGYREFEKLLGDAGEACLAIEVRPA